MDVGGKKKRKKPAPRGNIIQISYTKKPIYFYVNLTKKNMAKHKTIVLSGLGMGKFSSTLSLWSIPTVVTISEIIKRNEVSTQKAISTSTVSVKDENSGRTSCKSKMEIVMERGKNFEKFKPKSPKILQKQRTKPKSSTRILLPTDGKNCI